MNVTEIEVMRRVRAKVADATHEEAVSILSGQCSAEEYKRRTGILQGLGRLSEILDEIETEINSET